jgi:hypothetical protein
LILFNYVLLFPLECPLSLLSFPFKPPLLHHFLELLGFLLLLLQLKQPRLFGLLLLQLLLQLQVSQPLGVARFLTRKHLLQLLVS